MKHHHPHPRSLSPSIPLSSSPNIFSLDQLFSTVNFNFNSFFSHPSIYTLYSSTEIKSRIIMFKRNDHQSSSRRENLPDHRVKAVGCMAGIFQLISKYHRRRKFITSGSKKRPIEEGNNGMDNNSSPVKQLKLIKKLPAENHGGDLQIGRVVDVLPGKVIDDDDDDDDDEKGKRLMEALRKCDEDLRKIQRVLEEARAARSFSPERRRLTTFRHRTTAGKTPLNNNKYFWHAQQSKEWKLLNQKFMRMMTRDNDVDEQNSILNAAEASILINNGCLEDGNCETTPPPSILLLRWSDKVVKESIEEICRNMRCEQKRIHQNRVGSSRMHLLGLD